MLFPSVEFLVFLPAVYLLCWMAPRRRLKHMVLLAASYVFYAAWDWRFLGLILFSTVVDYLVGGRLYLETAEGRRRRLLWISLAANLGLLGYFKYANFFLDSALRLIHACGLTQVSPTTLEIILPVGISFYTFQTLSYTIDIYRGNLRPSDSFLEFALFVAFFPQLVAGPIVRASTFLPQLGRDNRVDSMRWLSGGAQFTRGYVKKVLIADRIAPYVDAVFSHPEQYQGATLWAAAFCYAVQIYCDFSGYSDMAIGVARTLGYRLPKNFDAPYLATSIQDFWRRWHISLSTWLRDYLYIPLGGSRRGFRAGNLMITMLLGGLWHGASWTFVVWGGYHGALLMIHRGWKRLAREYEWIAAWRRQPWWAAVAWAITLIAVLIGWVFFRAQTLGDAVLMVQRMFLPVLTLEPWVNKVGVAAGLGLLAWQYAQRLPAFRAGLRSIPVTVTGATIAMGIAVALVLAPEGATPFIYFQF